MSNICYIDVNQKEFGENKTGMVSFTIHSDDKVTIHSTVESTTIPYQLFEEIMTYTPMTVDLEIPNEIFIDKVCRTMALKLVQSMKSNTFLLNFFEMPKNKSVLWYNKSNYIVAKNKGKISYFLKVKHNSMFYLLEIPKLFINTTYSEYFYIKLNEKCQIPFRVDTFDLLENTTLKPIKLF